MSTTAAGSEQRALTSRRSLFASLFFGFCAHPARAHAICTQADAPRRFRARSCVTRPRMRAMRTTCESHKITPDHTMLLTSSLVHGYLGSTRPSLAA
ncbi:hypothetical protein OH76DRAFT_843358 [Lentinus brumalis]|uniref:Uncharacterized protein n=1 Tax=Lentinus brumalis TaxID=2498619 RepID=A0A371D1R5_9APHY|nr:hypothetical protein OH76DRAFT_843358 [Polyporus brumalis]